MVSGKGEGRMLFYKLVMIQTSHFGEKCREGVYSEIYRVLKPGCVFACYEWCLTDKYDASNEKHRLIKKQIEVRGAIEEGPAGDGPPTVANAKNAGYLGLCNPTRKPAAVLPRCEIRLQFSPCMRGFKKHLPSDTREGGKVDPLLPALSCFRFCVPASLSALGLSRSVDPFRMLVFAPPLIVCTSDSRLETKPTPSVRSMHAS